MKLSSLILLAALAVACAGGSDRVQRELKAVAAPDEPCTATGKGGAGAQEAAQKWCQDGIFSKVHSNTDGENFVVVLQFSTKGLKGFEADKSGALNRFRGITDQMAAAADMNVAFSLHDTDGKMIGGCARSRQQEETTCS